MSWASAACVVGVFAHVLLFAWGVRAVLARCWPGHAEAVVRDEPDYRSYLEGVDPP